MSIRALITFKSAFVLPLIKRETFTDVKHLYKDSNNHRSTEIKVYSSDINTAVYRSDQNKKHLFESDHASNKDCINYTVMPAGGDK